MAWTANKDTSVYVVSNDGVLKHGVLQKAIGSGISDYVNVEY